MIKVLIADDEPKIRRGIAESVDWAALGMEVCGFAGNGKVALEEIQAKQPDICLLDICMPILNGLALMEKIREIRPELICIVVSGYDEFEYAQKAVQLEAFDYILKPVDEVKLEHSLRRAKQRLEESSKVHRQLTIAKKMMQDDMPILREQLVRKILRGTMDETDAQVQMETYDMDVTYPCAMLRIAMAITMEQLEWDRQLLLYAVKNVSEEILGQYGTICFYMDDGNYINILLSAAQVMDLQALEDVIKDAIFEVFQTYVDVQSAYAGAYDEIGAIYSQWVEFRQKHLSSLVRQAKDYIDNNYFNQDISVQLVSDHCVVNPSYLSRVFKAEMDCTVIDYLTKMRMQQAIKLLEHTDKKVYEIAEQIGYKSQHYFCMAFKKVLEISPTEYRQKTNQ